MKYLTLSHSVVINSYIKILDTNFLVLFPLEGEYCYWRSHYGDYYTYTNLFLIWISFLGTAKNWSNSLRNLNINSKIHYLCVMSLLTNS